MVSTGVGIKCISCAEPRLHGQNTAGNRRRGSLLALAAVVALALCLIGLMLVFGNAEDGARSPSEAGERGAVARDIQIEGAGAVNLPATLGLPDGAGPGTRLPAVVILGGLGTTTRETVTDQGSSEALSRELSEALVQQGVVTLRYEHRGAGRSRLPAGKELRFDDIVADAGAALSFLAQRSEVDPGRLAVIGHQDGGLVAMQLAAVEPRIRGLALISTPGRPLLEVLADEVAASPSGDLPRLRSTVGTLLATGWLPEQIPSSLVAYFPRDNPEYLKDIFSIDPTALAGSVDAPVLFLRGEKATLGNKADEAALLAALPFGQSFVASGAGSALMIASQPAPGSASREKADHDDTGAVPVLQRSGEAIARVLTFLQDATRR